MKNKIKFHQIAQGSRVMIENPKSFEEWLESDTWVEVEQ